MIAAPDTLPVRLAHVGRSARTPAALAASGGFLAALLLPVSDWWITLWVGLWFGILAVALIAVGQRFGRGDGVAWSLVYWPKGAATEALLERSNVWQQFGHAFGVGSAILLALGAGLGLGSLLAI